MSSQTSSGASAPSAEPVAAQRLLIAWWLGCLLCLAIIVPAEIDRWNELGSEDGTAWLFDMNVDTTPYAVLFVTLPLFWLIRQPVLARPPRFLVRFAGWLGEAPRQVETAGGDSDSLGTQTSAAGGSNAGQSATLRVILAAMFVACAAAVSCLRVAATPVTPDGTAFAQLPPAFHDEYSYLFQARTFAAGRLSFPSHPTAPRLFDQMHVLNEGHFASRYFPGTGAWLTPFLQLGNPFAAQWLATIVTCVCVFLIGRELSCNGVGLLAGLLSAASPGLNLFGNLLLAHQPTLVGLGLFIYSFLRMQRAIQSPVSSGRLAVVGAFALLSGAGLSFAMLCRPMTAAGVGLPFGLWIAAWLLRNGRQHVKSAAVIVAGFAVPLAIGFGTAAVYNANSTGDPFKTPYQLYTELFTPRHMFGFNNVKRAEPLLSERTLDNYDRWAENLDAELAIQNVRNRFLASWQWTLGLIAVVLFGSTFIIGAWRHLGHRWWLIAAAIVSLHVAHVPYWYDGIFHWHYVFESGVLWCLLASAGVLLLVRLFQAVDRPWMIVWVGLLLCATVATNQVVARPFWNVSRLEAGINQLAFSRLRYLGFQQLLDQFVTNRPALVLVRHDPADRHIDYVSNPPALEGPLLIGRIPADARTSEEETVRLAREAFPDRSHYIFDAASGRLAQIR